MRLSNIPGTASGDILRLCRNLPNIVDNWEIDGDDVKKIDNASVPDALQDYDLPEIFDCTDADLDILPLVHVDDSEHFVKRHKYRREIANLLKSQGGNCSHRATSTHLVELLGKSGDGKIVLNKLRPSRDRIHSNCSIADHKRWLLQLIDALKALHFLGIVHRDMKTLNNMYTKDGQNLVLIGLESKWGNVMEPELKRNF